MARALYFSFHYKDVASFRVNVVRQSWLTMRDTSASFVDRSLWEEGKLKGEKFLKNLLDESLKGTSVTAVLAGSTTAERKWVKYEIFKSFCEGKGIFCIHINRIKSKDGRIAAKGKNPLNRLAVKVSSDFEKISFYELIDRKWTSFSLLSEVTNRKSNSMYFPMYGGWLDKLFNNKQSTTKKLHKLSALFDQEYDWISDNGYDNISGWVEKAFQKAKTD